MGDCKKTSYCSSKSSNNHSYYLPEYTILFSSIKTNEREEYGREYYDAFLPRC